METSFVGQITRHNNA